MTTKTLSHLRDEYSEMVESHNALCQKIGEADTPDPQDLVNCELSEKRIKAHELLIANAERLESDKAADVVARLGGNLRAKLADSNGDGPTIIRSASGRDVRMAVGRGQKLCNAQVPRYGIGELVRAAACGIRPSTPQAVRMALRSDQNSSGGYSVPSEWLSDWIDRAIEQSVVGPLASRMMMDAANVHVTTVEERPTIAVKNQLSKFSDSSITFGSKQLNAFTAGATVQASLEMLQDSPNAAAQIEAVCLRALGDWFDQVMLNGTGSAEPLGMLNRTDLPGDGSAGAVSWDMLAEAVTEVRKELYIANGIIVSPDVYNALFVQRELTAGDGGYLAKPMHLDGLPILATTHCDDDRILVGDFAQLLIGVREDARVELSASAGESFERNAATFRVKVRADFVPTDLKAFYLLGGVSLS